MKIFKIEKMVPELIQMNPAIFSLR